MVSKTQLITSLSKLTTRRGFVRGRKKFIINTERALKTGAITEREFKEFRQDLKRLERGQKARQVLKAGRADADIPPEAVREALREVAPERTTTKPLQPGEEVQIVRTVEGREQVLKGGVGPRGKLVTAIVKPVRRVPTEAEVLRSREEARFNLRPVKEKKPIEEIVLKTPTTKEEAVEQIQLRQAFPTFSTLQRLTGGELTITKKEVFKDPVPRQETDIEKIIRGVSTPIKFKGVPVIGDLERNIQKFLAFQTVRGEQSIKRSETQQGIFKAFSFISGKTDIAVSEKLGQEIKDITRPSTSLFVLGFKGFDKILGSVPKVGRFAKGAFGIGVGALFVGTEGQQIISGEKTIAQSLGTLEAFILTEQFVSAGSKAVSTRLKGLGKRFVPPEKVFEISVLKGEQKTPTVKTLPEAIGKFRAAEGPTGFEVISATPADFAPITTIRPGAKGRFGLEDPGLFVTPKGRASPGFLGIEDFAPARDVIPIKFSLFPKTPTPQLIEITNIRAVERLPTSIRESPGFTPIEEFFKLSEPGKAFITKRSEIGLGTAPRLPFVAEQTFPAPIPRTVIRQGKIVEVPVGGEIIKGDILRPGGTSELEAIIPPQEIIEVFTQKPRFTKLAGQFVPIREFFLSGTKISEPGIIPESFAKVSGEISAGRAGVSSIVEPSRIITVSDIFPSLSSIPSIGKSSQPIISSDLSVSLSNLQKSISGPTSQPSVLESIGLLPSPSVSVRDLSTPSGSKPIPSPQISEIVSNIQSEITGGSKPGPSLISSLVSGSESPLISESRTKLRIKKPRKEQKIYDAFALIGATGPKPRWQKLNKNQLRKSAALQLSQNVVDNTVSARGKIARRGSKRDTTKFTPVSKRRKLQQVKRPLPFVFGKFRDFEVVKGKPIQLKNEFIENTSARINTPGEFRGITVKGLLKQMKNKQKNMFKGLF